jgi:hypothetical protein
MEESTGIPQPAWRYDGKDAGRVTGGVNIGAASGERSGNSTPDRCNKSIHHLKQNNLPSWSKISLKEYFIQVFKNIL